MIIPLKSFYFIRHGETDWNKRGMIMGSKDIELNSNGISQAEQAKYSFEDADIGAIYSSSAKRASHTANILNEALGLQVTYTDLLTERGWGGV
jgi:broad specificity phosphatase PhoE